MGQIPGDGVNGEYVAFLYFFFGALLWPNGLIFQLFSNVFVLVLAHLELELVLFEVDDIGDDGDDL